MGDTLTIARSGPLAIVDHSEASGLVFVNMSDDSAQAAQYASSSSSSAVAAAQSAVAAEESANYAEEFGGAAYASISAGVAATPVAKFFRVWNGDTPRTYARYERTGSSPFYAVASPLATTSDLASTATDKGAALVSTPSGTVQNLFLARPTLLMASGDQTSILNAALSQARTDKKSLFIEAGARTVSAMVDASGANDTIAGMRGFGAGGTQITGSGNYPIVDIGGRYGDWGGFLAGYTNLMTSADTAAAALYSDGSLIFSNISGIVATNGYYGFYRVDGAPGAIQREFNNFWFTHRVQNWAHTAYVFGASSGSVHLNLYASAISSGSVWRGFECQDFSGENIRINIERTTFRDQVFRLPQAHDLSFWGVHNEEISLIGAGFNSNRSETSNAALVYWTGAGIAQFKQWTIDSSHFGPLRVKSISISGTTATAVLSDYGMQQKQASGSGFIVGDTIYVDGAADAGLVGSFVLTAVNPANAATTEGRNTIQFTVPGGLPASPQPASGADCLTVNLGPSLLADVPFFFVDGAGDQMFVESVHLRDIFRGGSTPAKRRTMLRLAAFGTNSRGRVGFEKISTGGQRSVHSHWLEPMRVIGYSRTSNVATVYFNRRHGLRADTVLNIAGATDTSFNGRTGGSLTAVDLFTVSFASAGADVALTRDTAATAIMETARISSISRTSDILTITTTAAHGFVADGEISARFSSGTVANFDNLLILDIPTTTTLTCRVPGADFGATADSGSLMLIEGGLSPSTLLSSSNPMGGITRFGEFDKYLAISPTRTINPGASVTSTETVQAANTPRDRARLNNLIGADARLGYSVALTSANTVTITVTNLMPTENMWAISTAYRVGQIRTTGTGATMRRYICTTAGTSASSGSGPSGTGSGITDGTAVWAFDSAAPVVTSGNIPVFFEIIRG